MTRPKARIEVLVIRDCPHAQAACELVNRVAGELGLAPRVEVILVQNAEEAQRLRFLGSPTIRLDGHDVEPGADQRTDFALSCRVYRTPTGRSGLPDETWLRTAIPLTNHIASPAGQNRCPGELVG